MSLASTRKTEFQSLTLPKNRDAYYGGKWHKPVEGR
jgi:hypothetical protein